MKEKEKIQKQTETKPLQECKKVKSITYSILWKADERRINSPYIPGAIQIQTNERKKRENQKQSQSGNVRKWKALPVVVQWRVDEAKSHNFPFQDSTLQTRRKKRKARNKGTVGE